MRCLGSWPQRCGSPQYIDRSQEYRVAQVLYDPSFVIHCCTLQNALNLVHQKHIKQKSYIMSRPKTFQFFFTIHIELFHLLCSSVENESSAAFLYSVSFRLFLAKFELQIFWLLRSVFASILCSLDLFSLFDSDREVVDYKSVYLASLSELFFCFHFDIYGKTGKPQRRFFKCTVHVVY